uniref:Uncharacterized protein n=1 Tax=Ditylenchus dipsaci TaxID=166011 RepID=A0A915CSL3_9BILA
MPSQAPSPVAPSYLPAAARPPSAPILNSGNGSISSQMQQPRFRLVSAPPPLTITMVRRQDKLNSTLSPRKSTPSADGNPVD